MSSNIIASVLQLSGIFVGCIGVLIILIGVLRSLHMYISFEIFCRHPRMSLDSVRYRLGSYLLLGLEFLIAADILETIFDPTLEHIAILGGIVIIRTVLNFFLNKEMEHIKKALQ